MPTAAEKQTIPTYTLAQNSPTGSTMIDVRAIKDDAFKLSEDFLVPHRRHYYLFVLVKQGCSTHWVDLQSYTIKPDTFYFTTPQQVHLKESTLPMVGYSACFTDEFLSLGENLPLRQLPVIQNPAGAHEITLTPQDLIYIEDVMQKMYAEFNNNNSWRNQMLTAWLRVLVIYMSRLYTEQFAEEKITTGYCMLKDFQALIGEHYYTLHHVAAYANLLSITPGYLNDVIKQQSGKTAIYHIHQRLIVEAKRRLLHTDLSVKQVAYELGFEDAAYFNRFFKRLAGDTPIAFREQIREMYS
jgi:AraC family transcriptional activator of pobA